LVDHELLAAVLQHLRHERQTVDGTAFIECGEDLGGALDLHQVAGSELGALHGFESPRKREATRMPLGVQLDVLRLTFTSLAMALQVAKSGLPSRSKSPVTTP